jgi:hypothetical protein
MARTVADQLVAGNEDGNVFNRIDCHAGRLQPWSL